MKPLDDEKRKEMWKEIHQAIVDSANPREGELTIEDIVEATGLTEPKLRRRLKRLMEEEVLGRRKIAIEGSKYNVYFPLKEITSEEILGILTE